MYAYKTAVAVKKIGYRNIKIYNGGIKDWAKSGMPLTRKYPLPDHTPRYISTEGLASLLADEAARGCKNEQGAATLVLFDLRNEPVLSEQQTVKEINTYKERLLTIDTPCPTITHLFDDCLTPEVRGDIPTDVRVVTITETGNRDAQIQAFFAKFGYQNFESLEFGMRGWIKGMHPVKSLQGQ